jgi:hypothetical protein
MDSLLALPMGIAGMFLLVILLFLLILSILMPYYVYRISLEAKATRQALERIQGLVSDLRRAAYNDGVVVVPRKKG